MAAAAALKNTLSPKNVISEEDDHTDSEDASNNSEANEAPAGLVVPDTTANALPSINEKPADLRKKATLIMQEVLQEPTPKHRNSNPQLLSPKVEDMDLEDKKSEDATPRKNAKKRRAGSAQRTSKDNYIDAADKVAAKPKK